jgi:hypothetical protein
MFFSYLKAIILTHLHSRMTRGSAVSALASGHLIESGIDACDELLENSGHMLLNTQHLQG